MSRTNDTGVKIISTPESWNEHYPHDKNLRDQAKKPWRGDRQKPFLREYSLPETSTEEDIVTYPNTTSKS